MIEQEQDFYGWANEQAALLSQDKFDQLDMFNLINEIKSLAIKEVLELEQSFEQLYKYLLLYQHGAAVRTSATSIHTLRRNIHRLLERSPSIREQITPEFLSSAWRYGSSEARAELEDEALPAQPDWTLEQLLSEDFLP